MHLIAQDLRTQSDVETRSYILKIRPHKQPTSEQQIGSNDISHSKIAVLLNSDASQTLMPPDGNPDLGSGAATATQEGDESVQTAEEQDRKSRECNLVILSIPYHTNEDPSKAVLENVFKKMRGVPKATFRAFRLGRGSAERPAPMMVQFQDADRSTALQSRRLVMNNKSELKGTPIRIFPDLTAKQREALPLEKIKAQEAREQGLWCELREGIATAPVPMRRKQFAKIRKEQDRMSRARNLVIRGIPYHTDEDTAEAIDCNVTQEVPWGDLGNPFQKCYAFRLGRGSNGRPPPMMVQFEDEDDIDALYNRNFVMKCGYRMKGTQIRISPDLTAKQRLALPFEREKVKQARERGLWCKLQEGVATDMVLIRKQMMGLTKEERIKADLTDTERWRRGWANCCNPARVANYNKPPQVCHMSPKYSPPVLQEMHGEMVGKDLPEHLVEKIVSMVPFPFIFKARGLSRSWRARFSSISSQADEAKDDIANFQELVGESCKNWKTLSPVWFPLDFRQCSSFAYDNDTQKWRRLPSLSFLPKHLHLIRATLQIEGALLHCMYDDSFGVGSQVLVANILTRSCKALPPRPNAQARIVVWKKLVVSEKLAEYKMFMVCENYPYSSHDEEPYYSDEYFRVTRGHSFRPESDYSAQIYDSKSNAWTSKMIALPSPSDIWRCSAWTTAAYFRGVMYFWMLEEGRALRILGLNFEEGKSKTSFRFSRMDGPEIFPLTLVAGNSALLCLGTSGARGAAKCDLHMLTVDLKALLLMEVARRKSSRWFGDSCRASSAGNCTFVTHTNELLSYHVDCNVWKSSVPTAVTHDSRGRDWTMTSFQPSLVPFVGV